MDSVITKRETRVSMIKTIRVHTAMGHSYDWTKLDLTANQINELNTIGYRGTDLSDRKTTFEEYLNSLNNGYTYSVTQVGFDSGDFGESYLVAYCKCCEKCKGP